MPPAPACHHRGRPFVSILVSTNRFAYIKTPIRYTQLYPGERLCDTYDPQQLLWDTKWGFMSHKLSCTTPATGNDRTRLTAGPSGRRGKTPCAADRGPRRDKAARRAFLIRYPGAFDGETKCGPRSSILNSKATFGPLPAISSSILLLRLRNSSSSTYRYTGPPSGSRSRALLCISSPSHASSLWLHSASPGIRERSAEAIRSLHATTHRSHTVP